MDIIKEELIENLKNHFTSQLMANLANEDMDEDEKAANVVLARKRINADSEGIAELVFLVSGDI